jgi:hypothetical protein
MPARKSPSPDEKPQFERFIETARQIGASETDEALGRVIGKIAPARGAGVVTPSAPHPRRNVKQVSS